MRWQIETSRSGRNDRIVKLLGTAGVFILRDKLQLDYFILRDKCMCDKWQLAKTNPKLTGVAGPLSIRDCWQPPFLWVVHTGISGRLFRAVGKAVR